MISTLKPFKKKKSIFLLKCYSLAKILSILKQEVEMQHRSYDDPLLQSLILQMLTGTHIYLFEWNYIAVHCIMVMAK